MLINPKVRWPSRWATGLAMQAAFSVSLIVSGACAPDVEGAPAAQKSETFPSDVRSHVLAIQSLSRGSRALLEDGKDQSRATMVTALPIGGDFVLVSREGMTQLFGDAAFLKETGHKVTRLPRYALVDDEGLPRIPVFNRGASKSFASESQQKDGERFRQRGVKAFAELWQQQLETDGDTVWPRDSPMSNLVAVAGVNHEGLASLYSVVEASRFGADKDTSPWLVKLSLPWNIDSEQRVIFSPDPRAWGRQYSIDRLGKLATTASISQEKAQANLGNHATFKLYVQEIKPDTDLLGRDIIETEALLDGSRSSFLQSGILSAAVELFVGRLNNSGQLTTPDGKVSPFQNMHDEFVVGTLSRTVFEQYVPEEARPEDVYGIPRDDVLLLATDAWPSSSDCSRDDELSGSDRIVPVGSPVFNPAQELVGVTHKLIYGRDLRPRTDSQSLPDDAVVAIVAQRAHAGSAVGDAVLRWNPGTSWMPRSK